MKKYIDCDGVILDTESGLFDEYYRLKESTPELRKKIYLQQMNWECWLKQADILNDSINILKNYNPKDTDILTKVHSLKEAIAKIEYFRKNNVKNNIVIVPDVIKKSQIVVANGNVLVDDSPLNLNDWEENKGISICCKENEFEFVKINSLDEVLNEEKLKKLIKRLER